MTSKGAGAPLTRHVSTVCACRELAPTDCAMRVLRQHTKQRSTRSTTVNVVSAVNGQRSVNAVSRPRHARAVGVTQRSTQSTVNAAFLVQADCTVRPTVNAVTAAVTSQHGPLRSGLSYRHRRCLAANCVPTLCTPVRRRGLSIRFAERTQHTHCHRLATLRPCFASQQSAATPACLEPYEAHWPTSRTASATQYTHTHLKVTKAAGVSRSVAAVRPSSMRPWSHGQASLSLRLCSQGVRLTWTDMLPGLRRSKRSPLMAFPGPYPLPVPNPTCPALATP